MTSQENPLGRIFILPQAIKTVARYAALQSYGVISLAPANMAETICRILKKDQNYGILVIMDDDGLIIDLNLIIEYGLRVKTVTDLVAESVKFNLEKSMGIPVKRVDVHVRGLRISNPD